MVSLPAFAAQTSDLPAGLTTYHLTILEGENALNNIRERTAREPIVQVEDSNHQPVVGVSVVFTLRSGPNGASGSFSSLNSYTAVTDAEGRARSRGFQPNAVVGKYEIKAAATIAGILIAIFIHERNTYSNESIAERNGIREDGEVMGTAIGGLGIGGGGAGATSGFTFGALSGATLGTSTGKTTTSAVGATKGAVAVTNDRTASGVSPVRSAGRSGTRLSRLLGKLPKWTLTELAAGSATIAGFAATQGQPRALGKHFTEIVTVPELDPSLALAFLLLLAGSIVVLRER